MSYAIYFIICPLPIPVKWKIGAGVRPLGRGSNSAGGKGQSPRGSSTVALRRRISYTGGMERMGNPALAPSEHFTYRHYKTWPDSERWELIDGQAWNMSPAPLRRHQELQHRLALRIGNFLTDKPCKVYEAPFDVLLPAGDEADDEVDSVVQPDLVVFCDRSKLTERGARCAPDLVVEILSPSTSRKDLNEKFRLYERQGVRGILGRRSCRLEPPGLPSQGRRTLRRGGTQGAPGRCLAYRVAGTRGLNRRSRGAVQGLGLKDRAPRARLGSAKPILITAQPPPESRC